MEHQRPIIIPHRTGIDPKDLFAINSNIYECIKAQRTPSRKRGWIYMLESLESAPGRVKIGKTWRRPSRRKKEWRRCNVPLAEIGDSYQNTFDYY